MSLVVPSLRGIVASAPWAKNELWRKAQTVPSLDLRFADSKSLTDAVSGQNLITFTRASSGTYVGSDGLIKTALANAPRFDHDPVTGESLGLLIEEQRTNLLLRSEEAASWVAVQQSGSTVTSNTVVSPTGETTADTLEIADNGYRYTGYSTSTITNYTASFYLRADSPQTVGLRITNTTGTESTKTTITVGATWKRYSVTVSCTVDPGAIRAGLDTRTSVGGTGSGVTIDVWGAQMEVGAFPTSYIPTTNAQVTRNADVATITGANFSSWYRQDEGTVFAEGDSNTSTPGPFLVTRGVNAGDRHQVALGSSATVNNGVVQASLPVSYTDGQRKVAYGYADNDIAFALSTGDLLTDSVATIPTNLTYATLGRFDFGGVQSLNGHCRRLTFFDRRLPNATLETITSP